MVTARIYIVRHGETQENHSGIIQGQLDTELNDSGRRQADLVARALQQIPFDFAHTSDLKRAVDTAECILRHHPNVVLNKAVELREKYMGLAQGLSIAERAQLPSAEYNHSIEPSQEFVGRMMAWWKREIVGGIGALPPRSAPYNILVVSHGGLIGTLVQNLLRSGEVQRGGGVGVWRLLNTAVTTIDFPDACEPILVKYGDISHLLAQSVEVVQDNADVNET
ncbi:hypothetical protein PC9H_000550 [Pleurotus ostreatus]|uniref:Phosphoglycerate mutase-like protein n=2 Tax=Pleurotus ostreatus TaxID=5322 RepID=A0A067P9B7_PLEO1|nr:uncharacterized protein PC9H_000550 [Pleurotus ostreatus]KAF7440206.1 hypothetical protein PC9H_000550 [Pleurotus ostreatus]KAJ8700513.1 hypothetical protein PTI98_003528 [Pleurotus ostreatus]KDQ33012.1 hypothetical protein PLEOSDRAFT_153320 [Pleurotus ostreatus PC15]